MTKLESAIHELRTSVKDHGTDIELFVRVNDEIGQAIAELRNLRQIVERRMVETLVVCKYKNCLRANWTAIKRLQQVYKFEELED